MRAAEVFVQSLEGLKVNPPISCSDWAEKHFYLSPESSNTSGLWKSTPDQVAILNAMGSDAIEKVDFFKPTRYGGTKMDIAVMFYFVDQKRRNGCFYQPTAGDSDEFVKSEVEPQIRDCETVGEKLLSKSDKSPQNTLSYKAFRGCNLYFKGGHSPKSYERMTLDFVILDELDQFSSDVGKKGDPTTLSWGRVRNSLFKKQIQTSKPTLASFSLIERSAAAAEDMLEYQVECPHCNQHSPVVWGGKDVPYGFKWETGKPETVRHHCMCCGEGWHNRDLPRAMKTGFWLGEKGWQTKDGIHWTKDGEPCPAPRHIAFKTWSGYSSFLSWRQIIEEFQDAQGDIEKLQAFHNNVLARPWDIKHAGTITSEIVDGIIPTDDISKVIAVTAGIDVQDDRIEVQYVGHDRDQNTYILGYEIYRGDMDDTAVYVEMGNDVLNARFNTGIRELSVMAAGMDTQGHHTAMVHRFLMANRKGKVFFGVNGNGSATYEIADKPGTYKDVKGSEFYSIGTNVLKQQVFSSIRNYDQERNSFRVWSECRLPQDYSSQLTAERMEIRKQNGVDKVVFTNDKKRRNEALDTLVYAKAAKSYIRQHRGRGGRALFGD